MKEQTLLTHVSTLLDDLDLREGKVQHENTGTYLLRYEHTTELNAFVYHPLLCLVLQGAKYVETNIKTFNFRAGQSLIVSHVLPVVSRITEASQAHPYVALVFPLDLDLLRSLATETNPLSNECQSNPFSMCLCDSDEDMENALLRYFCQCESVESRDLLAPITAREIHARLLMGEHAEHLKKYLWHDSTANRVYRAIQEICTDLSSPIVVPELAQRVGMSGSVFYKRFKEVTGTTPIQYQKEMRLLHARDSLRTSSMKVSEIAFNVGYENSAQFSREFSRKFGCSPREERQFAKAR